MLRFLLILLLCAAALVAPARAESSDPAVAYANAHGAAGINYRQGWFGEGDTRLHYVEAGAGPLIILYHGFPSTWFSWFDQMEVLKQHYRVVAVDGLGGGLSAKPETLAPYRVEQLANQLDGLARHLNGNRRFILLGHDWGAALAFSYAQAYPKRLRAVIGLSAPPYNLFLDLVSTDADQQARSQYMQRFRALTLEEIRAKNSGAQIAQLAYSGLLAGGALNAEEHALFINRLSDPETINGGMNWYRANIGEFAAITAKDHWPTHNRPIKVPALLLWGDQDQTFVSTAPQRAADYAKRLEVVMLPGVGHWASMEKPELANAAILAFLEKLSRRN
jgi:epoxide hydrolase 4